MADDDIREGSPKKKKAPPPEEAADRPRKQRPAEDDEDDEAPRQKKKKPAPDDDEAKPERDLGSSPLSALLPVGGSIFALLSMWIGLLSFVLAVVALLSWFDFTIAGTKLPRLATVFMPILWPLALLCGGLAFLTHKSKASYGSIAGNMRAIIGILISLVVMVIHGFLVFMFATSK